MVMDFDSSSYVNEVSRARTFGFMRDLEYMNAHNLALGGSMENAVALDEKLCLFVIIQEKNISSYHQRDVK